MIIDENEEVTTGQCGQTTNNTQWMPADYDTRSEALRQAIAWYGSPCVNVSALIKTAHEFNFFLGGNDLGMALNEAANRAMEDKKTRYVELPNDLSAGRVLGE